MDGQAMTLDGATLAFFAPFHDLDAARLAVAAASAAIDRAEDGATILDFDSSDAAQYFLLNGVVEIESRDGYRHVIEAGSDKARESLATRCPGDRRVTALGPVLLVRVAADAFADPVDKVAQETNAPRADEPPVMASIRAALAGNRFSLPSLPEVALRIRKAIADETASITRIAKIVSADPAIAAKLTKVANSPVYRGSDPANTCQAAIVRLGMTTTRELVTGFALREVFSPGDPALKKRMQESWRYSTEIGSICMLLAQMTPHLAAEQALLAGLVHDIGAPALLAHLHHHPEFAADAAAQQALIDELRGAVGGMVLRQWQFDEALVRSAEHGHDWTHAAAGPADYCDLVIIARLHALMKAGRAGDHPPLQQIPAWQKLNTDQLTPQTSLKILDEAKQRFGEIVKLLAA